MEIICVPLIVSIVYMAVECYKKWIAKGKEKWLNVIPVIALILGSVLGVVVYYIEPSIIVASNHWWALVVGAVSGLSAVGSNQMFKQLKKLGIEVKEVKESEEQSNGDE